MSVPFPPQELAHRVCSLDGSGNPYEVYEQRGLEARNGLVDLLSDG